MDEFIGTIKLFPYGWAPYGWTLCNGATLAMQQYMALYALIGIKFGGNGTTNFMLPNLQNAALITVAGQPMAYYICLSGLFPPRS